MKNDAFQNELISLNYNNKRLISENTEIKNTINMLKLENEKLKYELQETKMLLKDVTEENDKYKRGIRSDNEFLDAHYHNVIQNLKRNKKYYPTQLQKIYTIISFIGESWYVILQQIFNLPHYRTTQRYRKKFLNDFNLSMHSFDGKLENLQKLINLFTNKNDLRYVIAIDAISLKSYVSISKEGNVSGMKFIKKISVDDAKQYLENETDFNSFVEENKDQIENYVFVIYLCFLNPNMKSFPIVLIPDTKGNYAQDIFNKYIYSNKTKPY